jgi:hypothetical protein
MKHITLTKAVFAFGLFAAVGLLSPNISTAETTTNSSAKADTVIELINSMDVGARGDMVRILQAFLAKNPNILDPQYVTGYYGQLTKEAVRKFQKENNLDQVGRVGPKTLKAINDKLSTEPFSVDAKRAGCVHIPPGHLIAPGFLKKNGTTTNMIGTTTPSGVPCKDLPPGILKKINGDFDTKPPKDKDTVFPTLSNFSVSSITSTSATISFTASEPVVGKVFYGTTAAYGSTAGGSSTFASSSSVVLTGLQANTTYNASLKVMDKAGNIATSSNIVFTTTAAADTAAPMISGIFIGSLTSSSTIVYWTTNESAMGKVYVSTSSPVNKATATAVLGSSGVTSHALQLPNLTANTRYYILIESSDSSGNTATANELSFQTSVN